VTMMCLRLYARSRLPSERAHRLEVFLDNLDTRLPGWAFYFVLRVLTFMRRTTSDVEGQNGVARRSKEKGGFALTAASSMVEVVASTVKSTHRQGAERALRSHQTASSRSVTSEDLLELDANLTRRGFADVQAQHRVWRKYRVEFVSLGYWIVSSEDTSAKHDGVGPNFHRKRYLDSPSLVSPVSR
jgi:hypothetical protein